MSRSSAVTSVETRVVINEGFFLGWTGHVLGAGHVWTGHVVVVRTDGVSWAGGHLHWSHDWRHVLMTRTQLSVVMRDVVMVAMMSRVRILLTTHRTDHVRHVFMSHVSVGHGTERTPGISQVLSLVSSTHSTKLLRHETVSQDRTLLQTVLTTVSQHSLPPGQRYVGRISRVQGLDHLCQGSKQ